MSTTDEMRASELSDAKQRVFSLRLHKLYADGTARNSADSGAKLVDDPSGSDGVDFDAKLIVAEQLVAKLTEAADGADSTPAAWMPPIAKPFMWKPPTAKPAVCMPPTVKPDEMRDFELSNAESITLPTVGGTSPTAKPVVCTIPTVGPVVFAHTVAVDDIITVRDVSAEDAARALHDAMAAAATAAAAKAAARALVLATREPAGPARVYTLMDMGDDEMEPTVMIDVRASSEGRAWVEMAFHSPRFAMAINAEHDRNVAEWYGLMDEIERVYPRRFVVVRESEE